MKKLIIILFILMFFSDVKATHLMGGEITWECIKTGPKVGYYVFQMKLFRNSLVNYLKIIFHGNSSGKGSW